MSAPLNFVNQLPKEIVDKYAYKICWSGMTKLGNAQDTPTKLKATKHQNVQVYMPKNSIGLKLQEQAIPNAYLLPKRIVGIPPILGIQIARIGNT